ncbi:hypothetical protein [Haladaptatus sp. R4]|uniref:hypothetical protein n=1 Tax=Haladaptatus sp. R4 TaxID=1679489 RepID=UPI001CBFC880|nr:hypothetical protein [Haladaptatus sp. R4]
MSTSDSPQHIAHRGFADDYPENTPLAFENAAAHADASRWTSSVADRANSWFSTIRGSGG